MADSIPEPSRTTRSGTDREAPETVRETLETNPEAPEAVGGTTPEGVVRAFFRRLSDGDEAGVMALLHPDFLFRDAGGAFTARRDEIPSMLAWDLAARGRVEIESTEADGDVVRVRIRETNRFTELLALAPWEVEAEFLVRGGRILQEVARERTGEGPSFTERFQQALAPVARWAAAARPEDAARIFKEGRVTRYDGPTARQLLRLLEAYRREGGGGSAEA